MTLTPTNIQVIGRDLAINWSDGVESFLELERLRRACPCAACGGEPDVLGNVVRPNVTYNSSSFELTRFNIIGGYAVQPHWGDGHDSGLYSYRYLRQLAHPGGPA
jgi:DUF971 family protein